MLLFATGNTQVPASGFKDLRKNGEIKLFEIEKYGIPENLPKAHTW